LGISFQASSFPYISQGGIGGSESDRTVKYNNIMQDSVKKRSPSPEFMKHPIRKVISRGKRDICEKIQGTCESFLFYFGGRFCYFI
jgi:hypothetical protein